MTDFWVDDLPAFFADFGADTSLGYIASIAVGAGGTGYSVDDVLTLAAPTDGTAATAKVTHVVTGGIVDGVTLLTDGAGYTTGVKTTTVAPAGGANCTINVLTVDAPFKVILHNLYEAAILFGTEIEQQGPYCEARDSDIMGIVHGTGVWIDSVYYEVTSIQPDGTGISILKLSKD
jgi:hypothetical protein